MFFSFLRPKSNQISFVSKVLLTTYDDVKSCIFSLNLNNDISISRNHLQSAPVYTVRSGQVVVDKQLVQIFLDDCLKNCVPEDEKNATKACFQSYWE